MRKTLIIQDNMIDVFKDGYNIIEKTIYGEEVPRTLIQALTYARDALDMDNMNAVNTLNEVIETLEEALK